MSRYQLLFILLKFEIAIVRLHLLSTGLTILCRIFLSFFRHSCLEVVLPHGLLLYECRHKDVASSSLGGFSKIMQLSLRLSCSVKV